MNRGFQNGNIFEQFFCLYLLTFVYYADKEKSSTVQFAAVLLICIFFCQSTGYAYFIRRVFPALNFPLSGFNFPLNEILPARRYSILPLG